MRTQRVCPTSPIVWVALVSACLALVLIGCGGGSSSSSSPGGSASIDAVTVSGPNYTQAGQCANFSASITGSGNYDHTVLWYANGVAGGSASDGTISSTGSYCAPSQPPGTNPVLIKAVANGNASKTAEASTRIVEISINPSQAQMYTGGTQQFNAAATGGISNSVTWQVNGISGGNSTIGTISNAGLYTAPAQITNVAIAVEAALTEAPTVYSTANISLSAQIVISPQNVQLTYGATQQFTATINGVLSQVNWQATYGSITASGLYTANANQSPDTVKAWTPNANGIATVEVQGLKPTIASISPQPATALDTITITGTNLNPVATVAFPDARGGVIPATGALTNNSGTALTVTVPQGSVSGPLYVTTAQGLLSPVQSNTVQFQRLARLRLHAPKQDLSAGESVTLQYALLGDLTPHTINFSTDVGSFSGATYLAPGAVPSDAFADISACIAGTTSCDTLILALHPFRIVPDPPLVSLGGSLQLSAFLGSGSAGANWNLLAGGGSITPNGLYTAGNQTQRGGPALISAASSGATEQTSVSVTGAFPGLVSRIYEYFDQHNSNAPGKFVYGMAVNGNRLYVAASNHVGAYNDSYFWIDVYDISNRLAPVWLTAVESSSGGPLFSAGPYLYSYVDTDFAVSGYTSSITVYSLQTGVPVLTARTQVPLWSSITANQGIVSILPLSGTAPPKFQEVLLYDVSGGTINSTDLTIQLPSDADYFVPDTTIRVGNRLFVSNQKNDNLSGALLTYDLSSSSPALLGETTGRSLNFYNSGNLLFGANGGMDIYDISSQLPELQSHVDGINALELNSTQLLATTEQQGCQLLDIANPQEPKVTAILFDGVITACNWGTLQGSYVYSSEYIGGIAIYDATQTGGPIVQSRVYGGPHLTVLAYDLFSQPPYLYVPTSTNDGAVLDVYDNSTATPSLIGEYVDGSQSGYAVQSSGQYVYFGMSGDTGVLDVTQPASPSLVGTVPVPAISFAKANTTLYAGTAKNNLDVIDISNPAQPIILRTTALPDLPVKLRISGNLLFVADSSAGLFIYNISSPTSPVLLDQYTDFAGVNDVMITGTTAFVAADTDGLGILNISNPAQPSLISKTSLFRTDPFYYDNSLNEALSITANNGIVYVGTQLDNGLVFGLDCANLADPRIVSVYAYGDFVDTWVGSFLFNGNQLLVAGLLGGVYPIAQVDMSHPFDSINQYFPPLALQQPAPLGADRRARVATQVAHPASSPDRSRNRHLQFHRYQNPK